MRYNLSKKRFFFVFSVISWKFVKGKIGFLGKLSRGMKKGKELNGEEDVERDCYYLRRWRKPMKPRGGCLTP